MGKQAENEVIYVEGIILEEGTDAKEEKLSKPKGAARMAKGIASFAKMSRSSASLPKFKTLQGKQRTKFRRKLFRSLAKASKRLKKKRTP